MANSIALIEKYLTDAVDTVFAAESKTKVLENGSKYIDLNFKEAGYVKVFSCLMDGLSDYYRANGGSTGSPYSDQPAGDGYQIGNVSGKWEIMELTHDRGKQFKIDNMDNEETAGLTIATLLAEFLKTKVVPEVDETRISTLAAKASASLGNYKSETISANTIISNFNGAYEWLSEHEVPAEDQVIFVNPAVMTLIRNTTELSKRLTQVEYKDGDVTFTIEAYEGRPIIEVPSNRFFTGVVLGANGYYAASSSKVINYMICSKRAIVPIVKTNKVKVWTPDQVQNFDGYKVNFRIYHDIIVPKNKIAGVYVSVSATAASTKSNLLSVDIAKATSGYDFKAYYTNPAGLLGAKVIYSTAAYAVGDSYTAGATNQVITVGGNFSKISTETAAYFALVDAANKVIAASASVTLPT